LNHPDLFQEYRVVFIPGATAIHTASLRKIKEFFDAGRTVVGTTRLPDRAAEFGKDDEIHSIVSDIFGPPDQPARPFTRQANPQGGKAYFAPDPAPDILRAILAEALPVPDVKWESPFAVRGGNLSYIHKIVDGRSVYFFANSSGTPVDTVVDLRGRLELELWDPHTGTVSPADVTRSGPRSQPTTRLHLSLPPVRSVFVIGKP
jgi:hypothetical protein